MKIELLRWRAFLVRMTTIIFVFTFLLSAIDVLASPDIPPVIIDYFYETACSSCEKVDEEILPDLKANYNGRYLLKMHDVGVESNYLLLVAYQDELQILEDEDVCMIVDYNHVFNGFNAIKKGLLAQVDDSLTLRLESNWKAPETIHAPQDIAQSIEIARARVSAFTIFAVLMGGLLDGVNPCAIGTLVFFMSLLGVLKIKGRALIMMGIAFCMASFLTYTAIGFGLLRALHVTTGFPIAQTIIEWLMMVLLGVFACLSFLDAYRYNVTGDHKEISLQLPHWIKLRIHKIMRSGLTRGDVSRTRRRSTMARQDEGAKREAKMAGQLVFGAIFIGAAVTALESVCTGQVYVPTLILLIKDGESVTKALPLLLLYNTMFILPLVVVFILTYLGLKTERLLVWSKHNVVSSKIMLGFFFLIMAVLIWMM